MNELQREMSDRDLVGKRWLSLFSLMLPMAGCATMSGDLRERAEAAFRRQNELSSQFMLIGLELESTNPGRYERLTSAERSMLNACEVLNELAIMKRDGKRVGFNQKRHIPSTLSRCESSADGFAHLLAGESR